MIRIALTKTEDWCQLLVQGHADFDRHGRDIVCAAVSVLVATLADYVEDEAGCGIQASVQIQSGYACVRAEGNTWDAFRLVYRGLSRLARTYPKHVAVVLGEKTGEETSNKEERT